MSAKNLELLTKQRKPAGEPTLSGGGPRTSQSEHRFQIYKRYPEREAAEHSGCDYSTLKRKRRAALVPSVDLGAGSVG